MASTCITEQGDCLRELGRLDEAAAAYEERIRRGEQLGDDRGVAVGKAQLGTLHMLQSRYITDFEHHLAGRLAYVMCGGDLSGPALVGEEYLLDLEREVFLSLLGEEKTRERIASILESNKPLRN